MSTGQGKSIRALFAAPDALWPKWQPALLRACPELDLRREGAPDSFDAIIFAPGGAISDLSPFRNVRLVQSLWAGVEAIISNPTLTQPLARMVDPSLTQGMAEYCTGWTMRAHLEMDRYAQDGIWRNGQIPPLAHERGVTILGMGALGQSIAKMLSAIGFKLTGLSNSARPVPGVDVVSQDCLELALQRAEVLIAVLPDTDQTRELLDADRLAQLPEGAWIINAGRGSLIDQTALIAALDRGQVGHAVLDVFQSEPLAPEHAFWAHKNITVTPHIAAETRPETAAQLVADNLRRAMKDEPLLHIVNRAAGY